MRDNHTLPLRFKLDEAHESIDTSGPLFLHATKYLTVWEEHEDGFWDAYAGVNRSRRWV